MKGNMKSLSHYLIQPLDVAIAIMFKGYGHETLKWPQLYGYNIHLTSNYQMLGLGNIFQTYASKNNLYSI